MALNRREFIRGGLSLAVGSQVWAPVVAAETRPAVAALDKSQLIYLTPLLGNGTESACHGEVWFVHHAGKVYVVTQADAWRAEAVRRGHTRAKIWIGEFGTWKSAKGRYRSAPILELAGSLETDAAMQREVLAQFAPKYAAEWGSWGPRFKNGLADGSRVMLRYEIQA